MTVTKGSVWRHHRGNVYTVLEIANTSYPSEEFHAIVVYIGSNGNVWARPLSEFITKFEVLFDGTKKANS